MTDVFVIRNQLGHYWGKSKSWVDGSEPKRVLRTVHRDEAVNTLFELSSKDFELRGDIIATELTSRGDPVIEPSQIPLPVDPELEASEAEAAPGEQDAPSEADSTPNAEDSPLSDEPVV